MKMKKNLNLFRDENIRFRTKIQVLENEIVKKEKLIDDIMSQQDIIGRPISK